MYEYLHEIMTVAPSDAYRETYAAGSCDLTEKQHMMLVGTAAKLYERMKERGATAAELTDVAYYTRICIDARRYKLDYETAKENYHIKDLTIKYPRLEMDIPEEEEEEEEESNG